MVKQLFGVILPVLTFIGGLHIQKYVDNLDLQKVQQECEKSIETNILLAEFYQRYRFDILSKYIPGTVPILKSDQFDKKDHRGLIEQLDMILARK